jgi:predicted membrane protein
MSDTTSNTTPSQDASSLPIPPQVLVDTWKNRRRMAYVALIAEIIFTGIFTAICVIPWLEITDHKIDTLSSVITWFYAAMSSIIGAYIGFTTLAFIKRA